MHTPLSRLLCAPLVLAGSPALLAQFATVDLSSFANVRIQSLQGAAASFPEGQVTLGGIPFSIQTVGQNNAWSAYHASAAHTGTIDIPIRVCGASHVYTLIHTYYGQPGPNSYVALEFFGSNGAYHRKDLIGNVDVRDYMQNTFTNSINNTTTTNVFSAGSGAQNQVRLDMQTIQLPAQFQAEMLMSMRLTSTGGVPISCGSIQGLTVRSTATPPPCATAGAYGAGCPNTSPLTLSASARPLAGTTIQLIAGNIPPTASLTAFLLDLTGGLPGTNLGVLGMPGCQMYNPGAAVFFRLSNGAPTVNLPFAVPNAGFNGVHVHCQSYVLDTTVPVNPAGATASNGLQLTLGTV